jgi:hypothetical protein
LETILVDSSSSSDCTVGRESGAKQGIILRLNLHGSL